MRSHQCVDSKGNGDSDSDSDCTNSCGNYAKVSNNNNNNKRCPNQIFDFSYSIPLASEGIFMPNRIVPYFV